MKSLRSLLRAVKPRSNGIAVRRDVARLIRNGNTARSRGDWPEAAAAYEGSLDIAPGLAHIWVQLGHARKEAGNLEGAQVAYARAAELAPADADPRIHLGLAAKLLGRSDQANGHYLAALERLPGDLPIAIDVLRTAPTDGPERERVMARIAALLGMVAPAGFSTHDVPASRAVCTDITDLLAYFGHARLPTGIQRVQIEIVLAIGAATSDLVTICCYSAQRRGWLAVEATRFLALARMALASDDCDDTAWRREVVAMHVALAITPVLRFAPGAVLLNLGTSWSERNYFLHVRAARAESGLAYVPVVYDCIPMFAPQWFPTALVRDYRAWMSGLFDTACGVIAISEATRSDLLRMAAEHGGEVAPDTIGVVAMDGDFRRNDRQAVGVERLAVWNLEPEAYVLMVSTIEPRKNHIGAFEAWLRLAARYGARKLPKLVCVGGKGWLNDPVHAMLRRHRLLRSKVVLLSGIADAELDLLYRCARFTLYPSLYEGWGLPVTESLCHGRVPAISNGSSLPEAGGSFAVYFDPNDPATIAEAIEPLIFDTAVRHRAEQRIQADFQPRSWHQIALAITTKAAALASRDLQGHAVPRVEPGVFYAMGTDFSQNADTAPGERFRAGWNWPSPSTQGNPIGEKNSTLSIMLPEGSWALQLNISGEPGTSYRITTPGFEYEYLFDRSGPAAWIAVPLSCDSNGVADIRLSAHGPMLLSGFAVTRPGAPPPPIGGSAPA